MGRNVAVALSLSFLIASFMVTVASSASPNMIENSWTTKASMNEARAYLGVAVVNGKIYAIGGDASQVIGNVVPGTTRSNDLVSTNEEYDPETDQWTIKTPMPTARALFGITTNQGKIYCIGGYDSNYQDLSVNEVYDPAMDSWDTKAAMPTLAYGVIANTVGDKIYVMGGPTSIGSVDESVNYVYDPESNSWVSKMRPPNDITSLGSWVIGDKIYFIGADSLNGILVIQAYDTINDDWSILAPSHVGIMSGNGAGVTTGVYAPKEICFFDEKVTYVFDLANGNWTTGVSMPTARMCVGVAVVNDTFYVIGGRSGPSGYITMMDASAVTEEYVPFGYKTDFTPPRIMLQSPENKTYSVSDVSLSLTVNEAVSWIRYSLDNQDNVTITGNTTLTGLAYGEHNITVYATDIAGNVGSSETIIFTVAKPEPFPTTIVAVASLASAIAIGAGLLIYFKKSKKRQ